MYALACGPIGLGPQDWRSRSDQIFCSDTWGHHNDVARRVSVGLDSALRFVCERGMYPRLLGAVADFGNV